MKKRKKLFVLPCLLLAFCMLLAGCDKNKDPGDVETDDPPPSVAVDEDVPQDISELLEQIDAGHAIAEPADMDAFRVDFREAAEAAGLDLTEAVFSGSYGAPSVEWETYGDGWDVWFEFLAGTGQAFGEQSFLERMHRISAADNAEPYMSEPAADSAVYLIHGDDGDDLYLLDYQIETGKCAYMMVHLSDGIDAGIPAEASAQIRGFISVAGLSDRYPELAAIEGVS